MTVYLRQLQFTLKYSVIDDTRKRTIECSSDCIDKLTSNSNRRPRSICPYAVKVEQDDPLLVFLFL